MVWISAVLQEVVIYMDDYRLHQLTAEKVRKKFGSHDVLYSKYDPKIPASAEREYIRLTNAYVRILKEELEKSYRS